VRKPQRHAGVQTVERLNQGRHQFEFQDLVADDVQPVLPAAGHLLDALRQARDVQHQPGGLIGQQLARRRQLQPVAAAVEQQRIEPFFQLPGRVRHRRRRAAQLHRRPRQAAAVADGFQQRQFIHRQHVRFLRTCSSGRSYDKAPGPAHYGYTLSNDSQGDHHEPF
jgi:hypothetical protein